MFDTLTNSLFVFTPDYCLIVSTKNLGRLRKRTAAGGAATSELHEDELKVADVKLSNDEGMCVGRNTDISPSFCVAYFVNCPQSVAQYYQGCN